MWTLLQRRTSVLLIVVVTLHMIWPSQAAQGGPLSSVAASDYFHHHDADLLNELFNDDSTTPPPPPESLLRFPIGTATGVGSAPYAEWAHYHWVWLSNDRASQAAMTEYAAEYRNRSIRVGAVNMDSRWETGFNNFKFNSKYPNVTGMVEHFHGEDVRVIFWITSMVDVDSDNYQDGDKHGYFIKDLLGKSALMSWWHGRGSLLDYSNPDAVKWWHEQMDKALSTGIDGWKCDGTDPYILEVVDARGHSGHVSYRNYADHYYGDFFDHTRAVRGKDALIMSRPVDVFGPLFFRFSPKRVMFSGWVGDADPTFSGLISTLKRYLQSAWDGYANFGSDIGGYRTGNGTLGRTKELFIRWAQLGAFSPLMENGGDKEHRPWMFDSDGSTLIEDTYRDLVETHYQLVPYLLTTGTLAYNHSRSSLMPLAPHQDFVDKLIDEFNPPTYNYMLGPDILVAPITSDPAQVSVTFPQISTKSNGGDGGGGGGVDEKDTYVAWWNRSLTYRAGDTAEFHNVSLDVFTVFHRTGSLFPLRPAAMASHQPFSNKPCTDVLELHVYNPTATSPFPVQVVTNDDRPGLVAAYWRDPLAKSTGQHGLNSSGIHFTITAHPTLSVSIHVHFGHSGTGSSGDGRHPPAEEPLHPCTLHHGVNICRRNGNEQIKVCSKESRYVQHDMSARPGQLFPTHNLHHDPAMLEEQKPYLSCAGGYGDIVVPHGRIPHGVYLSVWMV